MSHGSEGQGCVVDSASWRLSSRLQKTRYGTYAMLLRAQLPGGEDLAAFESRLLGLQREEEGRGAATPKSLEVAEASKTGGREGSKKKNGGGKREQEEAP